MSQELNQSELLHENNEVKVDNSSEVTIKRLEKELLESQQRYFSLAADFDNSRKRAAKEYESVRFDASARLLRSILDIVDDFDRAVEAESADKEGFLLIKKAFEKFLQQNNVTVIKSTKHFDPELHEAVMHVADSGVESGNIVSFLQKGYLLQDKILRPAKVSIAQ